MSADYPMFALSEEHRAIREAVRAVCDAKVAPHAAAVDEEARYPREAADALRAADFHAPHAPEKKLGIKGSPTREVYLDSVRVPADRMIGAEGEGFSIAMRTLDHTRVTI